MAQIKRKCLECNEVIQGRVDKKFCSDQCRNAHNNVLNSDVTNFVRNVNNSLRKNRRILEANLKGETSKIGVQKLKDLGFNFNYYTNIKTTKNNNSYYFCYEFGYLQLEGEMVLIVKNKKNESA
ncbi:MAG: hypothetical protein LCH32_02760 [Bacteroidetes bacterium]|nr:hypothetical protein [Bacteroidota bacterium]